MRSRFLIVGVIIAATFAAQPVSGPLSVKDYVKIALDHNPQLRGSASAVEGSAAKVEGSAADMLPQLSASAGVSRSGSLAPYTAGNSANAGVKASLLLFDFTKTPLSYRATKEGLNASRADQNSSIQSVILLAQTSYFNYQLQQQIVVVDEDALKQAQDHLVQAEALFEVGKQPQASVTKAKVDVANAQVTLIKQRNTFSIARLQLDVAAGVPLADPVVLTDSIDGTLDSIDHSQAMETALSKRPEILSANATVAASRLQARAATLEYLPSFGASGGYNWQMAEGDTAAGQGWNVGVNASIPIYDGGATHANIRSARAAVQKAESDRDIAVQTIMTDVDQSLLNRTSALQEIEASKVLVQEATEGLQLSQEQYKAGLAAPLVVTDAEVTLANARISLAQARYDYHTAQISLTKAMGILQP